MLPIKPLNVKLLKLKSKQMLLTLLLEEIDK